MPESRTVRAWYQQTNVSISVISFASFFAGAACVLIRADRTTVAMAGPRRALIGQRRAAAANDPAGVAAVATALGDWRTAAGLTQTEVAAALGVALGTYSSYELGHTAIPAYLVRNLAERFRVASGQLLGLHVQGDGEDGGA